MKPKNISLMAVLFCGAMTLTMFQNCSKVAVVDSSGIQNKAENVALATDEQGNEIPVDVVDADEVIPGDDDSPVIPVPMPAPTDPVAGSPTPAPAPEPAPSDDGDPVAETPMPAPSPSPAPTDDTKNPPVAGQPPKSGDAPTDDGDTTADEPTDEGDLVAACGLNLKTIHNVVDLAQFSGQDVNLELLKGKTLVYSSDPAISLKSLSVDVAVGRTILCGCKVDKLDIKKGRLEVYHSEIKEIGDRRGVLIRDTASILPAGI